MTSLKRKSGQFIPISTIVMFTTVVFLIAIVNIYKVARVKLKVQNLADAAALNLASQAAQAYNVVTDRNEWLNHMTAGIPSPSDPDAPSNIKDCSAFNMGKPNDKWIPPITCVENNYDPKSKSVFNRRVWDARGNNRTATEGAIGYAMLIHTVNVAQKLFVMAYNSFLGDMSSGVGSASSLNGPSNFEGLLRKDIPDLDKPNIHLIAWNQGDLDPDEAHKLVQQKGRKNFDSTRMRPLKFKVHHDIETRYQTNKGVERATLGSLLYKSINYGDRSKRNGPLSGQTPEDVGWMIPDEQRMPKITYVGSTGGTTSSVGVGVYVSQDMQLPVIGHIVIGARSKAYVVKGSGETGDKGTFPIFKPTYWVKLAN